MRDRDVRAALHSHLRAYHEDPKTRVVDEMAVWAGTVRIDVAVLNGETCGFEIKSDKDTLDRLPYQAEIYGKVFDKITLVVGERHAKKSTAMVPKWWGVIVAREDNQGGVTLVEKRKPKSNRQLDSDIIVQLLWKEEAILLLERLGFTRGWRSKRMKEIRAQITSTLSTSELATHVREIVKAREGWLGQAISNEFNMPIDADRNPIFQTPGID